MHPACPTPSTKQLAPTDPILGPENLLKTEKVPGIPGEVHFCAPAFSYVLRTKKVILGHIILLQVHRLDPGDLPKPASKLALKCFAPISMVSRHWSSRLALKPAFNFVSSYKLFVLLPFPSTCSLALFAPAAAFLARQHSCQLLQVQSC